MVEVRPATHADIESLVRMRAAFSDEFAADTHPDGYTPALAQPEWQGNLREIVGRRLGTGTMHIVVVDGAHGPVACAAGVVNELFPGPNVPDGRVGYVMAVFTDPDYRLRGYSTAMMAALLAWFDRMGVLRVDLNAATAAEAIYRKQGFTDHHGTSLRRRRPL